MNKIIEKKFCKIHNTCLWYIYIDETGAEHQVCQSCEDDSNKRISQEMRAMQSEAEMELRK